MSWESKEDYTGLGISNKLSIKSATENRSGQYLEKLGKDGSIAATKAYGTNNATPTNDYVIEDAISFTLAQIKLGTVKTVGGKKYVLQQVSASTGAGQEPTFSAQAVQVEDSATTDFTYDLPAWSITPEEVAQELFSAFTLPAGTQASPKNVGCELTNCSAIASIVVGLHNKNGDPQASSIHSGKIVVSLTIGQYGEMAPEVTPAQGWEVSSPLTCSDADSDLPSWTCSLTKTLAKTTVQQGQGS